MAQTTIRTTPANNKILRECLSNISHQNSQRLYQILSSSYQDGKLTLSPYSKTTERRFKK
jgi:hypothetical protein